MLLLVALVLGDVLDGALEGLSAGFFSTEALAGFLGALGFGGAIALAVTGSTSLAVVIGLVLGVLLGCAAARASRFLHGTGETDTVRTSDMVEKIGRVVSAIPEDGFGVVSISVGGHLTRLNARSSVPVAGRHPGQRHLGHLAHGRPRRAPLPALTPSSPTATHR